jgi:hypothetical protein
VTPADWRAILVVLACVVFAFTVAIVAARRWKL